MDNYRSCVECPFLESYNTKDFCGAMKIRREIPPSTLVDYCWTPDHRNCINFIREIKEVKSEIVD
ncbi:MAG: hypothetical protein AABX35_01970 [Nanoarchaeota archaeon]